MDAQWGEWHQAPDWVNGTIPVIATPGNHEYLDDSQRKRIWTTKGGKEVKIDVDEYSLHAPGVFKLLIEDEFEQSGSLLVQENGQIQSIDTGIDTITGFSQAELKGKIILGGGAPYDRKSNRNSNFKYTLAPTIFFPYSRRAQRKFKRNGLLY